MHMRPITVKLSESASFDFHPVRPLTPQDRIPLVLVLPGGGYLYISQREGEPVALRLNTHYLHAAVLRYTTAMHRHVTLDDLIAEVRAVLDWFQSQSAVYQIDLDRISVLGFSAGGNLAAHCSSQLADRLYKAILAYPATQFASMTEADLEARFQRMYAKAAFPDGGPVLDAERIRQTMAGLLACDPTLAITRRTRPTFVFQTDEDWLVDPLGTLGYCLALRSHGVPFELFHCQKGPHGLALADETGNPALYRHQARWFDLAMEWLKDQDAVPIQDR